MTPPNAGETIERQANEISRLNAEIVNLQRDVLDEHDSNRRAVAEIERLRLLMVGVLYADENAIEQARAVVERYCPACGGTQGDGTQPCAYAGCPKRE